MILNIKYPDGMYGRYVSFARERMADQIVTLYAQADAFGVALVELQMLRDRQLPPDDPWAANAPRNPDGTKVWPS